MKWRSIITLALIFMCVGCYRQHPSTYKSKNGSGIFFPFFLAEKTMIVNQEGNNEMEGHYLKITRVINDSTFCINIPDEFYLNAKNLSHWMLGWPTGKPYYDAGNENLCEIASIDQEKKIIVTGKLLRGEGRPQLNQRVVFWNKEPSGFGRLGEKALIEPGKWETFSGASVEFGAVILDSTRNCWIMYLQEVDTTHVKIYAAVSADLENWIPANNGEAILTADNFKETSWAGRAEDGITPQTARLYCAIQYQGMWYFYLSGYSKNGKREIGLVEAKDPLQGPYKVIPTPVITPGQGKYDINGCFYPKICRANNKFLIYYDGVGEDGTERLCLAESKDLMNWDKYDGNPVIDRHYGWRSGPFTSEPNYVECRGDTVWLMLGGYKKYNTEFNLNDSIGHRLPLDTSMFSSSESEKGKHISGNVMDAELGVFMSVDCGRTFRPHINNPVWLNDYSDSLQNDHLGGDFYLTSFKASEYIIYQAKSANPARYNILLRTK